MRVAAGDSFMDDILPCSRRAMLKGLFLGAAAWAFKSLLPGSASLAGENKPAAPKPPRPPGTCGGWCDKTGNGMCDRSEQATKPCGALKCAGNKSNVSRKDAKAKGAPDGTCA